MDVKFSIIIPTYNVEKFIDKAILSVTNQLKSNYEVIVVDDGSSDNTVAVVKNLQRHNKSIKIYKQTNKGPSSARNLGIDKAKGTYVIFLDGDDSLTPDFFDCITHIQTLHKMDTIIHNVYGVVPNTNKFPLYQGIMIPGDDGIYSVKQCQALPFLVNVWLCCFNLTLIKKQKIRFDETLSYGEDWLFMNQYLCLCNKFYWTNRCLYNYSINVENSLSSVTDLRCVHVFDAFNLCICNFKKYNLWDIYEFNHYLKCIFHICWFFNEKLKYSNINSEINKIYRSNVKSFCSKISTPYLYSLMNHLNNDDRRILRAIINNSYLYLLYLKKITKSDVRFFIDKLKKHIKSFFRPFKIICKWFEEFFSILYYLIKIIKCIYK